MQIPTILSVDLTTTMPVPAAASLNVLTEKLSVLRPDRSWEIALCRCELPLEWLIRESQTFLHPNELARFAGMKFPRRQISYLSGRYAAKLAVRALFPELEPARIWVDSGVMDFPVVRLPAGRTVQVTISHSDTAAWAIAFDEAHPLGLDVEIVREGREKVIATQLTDGEKELVKSLKAPPPLSHALLWTMKEALSKVLRTGLMTPFEIYAVQDLQETEHGWTALFKNFAQYKCLSFTSGSYVCSIVLPKKSELTIPTSFQSPCQISREP